MLARLVILVCFIPCIWWVLNYQHLWLFCLAVLSILFYPDFFINHKPPVVSYRAIPSIWAKLYKALISYPYDGEIPLSSSKNFSHLPYTLPVIHFKTWHKHSCYVCRLWSSNCYFLLSRYTRILLDNSISCGDSATIWVCHVNNAQRPWFVIVLIALEDGLPV